MELEVEVVSEDIIKPSTPTPHNLSHYQLSFLDQITPPVYNPLTLFYPTNGSDIKFSNIDKFEHLRQSLSDVLTRFYPLAGRIKDNLVIDCNDQGIPFLQARVNCQLSDVLANPVPRELNKLVPFKLDDAEQVPLGIQFNIFQCGGIGIGVCISHKVGDALSLFTFVRNWAATARTEPDIVCPLFESAKLFPPKNLSGFKPRTGIVTNNIVSKRFVFRACEIESLRAKYGKSPILENQRRPSRVETLSAFLWTRFVAATKVESGPDRFYSLIHAVNLRTRFDPPLPEHSFGNYYRIAFTVPSKGTKEDCPHLVNQMRQSISKIDNEYVKKLEKGDEHLNFIKDKAETAISGEMVPFSFTSLCRFPMYEADFGWGKPVWVGSPSLTFKNLVVFLDNVGGDGIEALVHMEEEDMARFQDDEELMALVSPNGSRRI